MEDNNIIKSRQFELFDISDKKAPKASKSLKEPKAKKKKLDSINSYNNEEIRKALTKLSTIARDNQDNEDKLKEIYITALKITLNAKYHALEVINRNEEDVEKWIREDINFAKKLNELDAYFVEEALIGLLKSIKNGNINAIMFYLMNKEPLKWLPPWKIHETNKMTEINLTDFHKLLKKAATELKEEIKEINAEEIKDEPSSTQEDSVDSTDSNGSNGSNGSSDSSGSTGSTGSTKTAKLDTLKK